MKKILVAIIAIFLMTGISRAAEAREKPTLTVKSKSNASITLKAAYFNFASKNVDILVKIKNKTTGKIDTQSFGKVKMGVDGDKKITVDQLDPGTKYSFKIKVKRSRGGDYTPYSMLKTTTTKK